jgi:hypothetical protein
MIEFSWVEITYLDVLHGFCFGVLSIFTPFSLLARCFRRWPGTGELKRSGIRGRFLPDPILLLPLAAASATQAHDDTTTKATSKHVSTRTSKRVYDWDRGYSEFHDLLLCGIGRTSRPAGTTAISSAVTPGHVCTDSHRQHQLDLIPPVQL